MSPADCSEAALFQALESGDRKEADDAKAKFAELLNGSKESWLVNGLVHYCTATASARAVDVLVKVPAPHDKYLCDKLSEGLKGGSGWRVDALALLGHIVRRQPSWLHKILTYPLFRDLLAVLKTEREIKPLVSGLLLLVTLLPMIPALVAPHLHDVFAVFGRLAAWGDRSSSLHRHLHQHLQFALYGLFQNLYGMFPCNFVDFIKKEYSKRENVEVFTHTVKPMLENVKFHPLLVTASKTTETDSARWLKMEHHDIVVECRRFSSALEGARADEERRFRSRCGTDVSALAASAHSALAAKASNSTPNLTESQTTSTKMTLTTANSGEEKWFSLHQVCGTSALSAPQTPLPSLPSLPSLPPLGKQQSAGGSPPEAAVEATPENTPIKDAKQRFDFPNDSPVVRTLGSRLAQPHPHSHSVSSLSYSQPPSPQSKDDGEAPSTRKDAFYAHHRLNRVLHDRSQQTVSPLKRTPGAPPDSPVPLGAAAPVSGTTDWPLARPEPRRDGLPLPLPLPLEVVVVVESNREDSEVTELSKRGEVMRSASEAEDRDEDAGTRWDDEAMCEGEDSICREKRHGLHMPNSTSMLDLANRATRSRFLSQCIVESTPADVGAAGAAAGGERSGSGVAARKTSSCPNLKFGRTGVGRESAAAIVEKIRRETEKSRRTAETQTVEIWPQGHEHLLGDILRNVCDRSAESAAATASDDNFDSDVAPYSAVDRYVETLTPVKFAGDKRDEVAALRLELEIVYLELLYERHRREVHAIRNRRLLGRSRKNRAAEEQNLDLTRQMALLTDEREELREQLDRQKRSTQSAELKHQENVKYWQSRLASREAELEFERREKERLASLLLERRAVPDETCDDVQNLRAALFDASQQLQRAIRRSEMGERQSETIKRLQREIVMYGERDAKRRELVDSLPSKTDRLVARVTQQYKERLAGAQALLQTQSCRMDCLQAREAELEATVVAKELAAQDLKRQLRLVKEEYGEKLKSVEDKYQSIKRINQRLETHCFELLQRVPQSPQTTSRDVTSGFSPQSSPLSASLASSEGHGSLLASRVDEIRNLQFIVHAQERLEESTSNSVNNANPEDDAR